MFERYPHDDGAGTGTKSTPTGALGSPTSGDLAGATETGTTTVALRHADGVVLAADRRASVGGGRFVTNKDARKIEPVHPTAAVAMAGSVGGMQEFVRTMRAEASLYAARRNRRMSMDALSTLAGNVLRSGPYVSLPTLGGVDEEGPRVFDLDFAGGVMEADYVASGSGMQLAYGVLEGDFEDDLDASDARDVAARAVESAVARDTASGDGLTLVEVTGEGVVTHEHDDAAEVA